MPIVIDMSGLRSSLLNAAVTKDEVGQIVRGIAAAARQRWIKKAQTHLKSTSRDYIQGIGEVEYKNQVATIQLTGKLPNMVEEGYSAHDMRETLLGAGAKNVKMTKDGHRYNTVPFRHGTPGTGGRNVGREMPKEIHREAKKLIPTLSSPGLKGRPGKVSYGDRLQINARTGTAARKILSTKERPWHWGSTYLGMIREQKTYAKASQNQYTTFRRISSNVKRGDKHWMHPGIAAHHFIPQVEREVSMLAKDIIENVMRSKKIR